MNGLLQRPFAGLSLAIEPNVWFKDIHGLYLMRSKRFFTRQIKRISGSIPRRCAAAYFPEANALVSVDSVARKSNTPVSKFVPVTIAASKNAEAAFARVRDEALAAVHT
jgi:hypothetical protein